MSDWWLRVSAWPHRREALFFLAMTAVVGVLTACFGL